MQEILDCETCRYYFVNYWAPKMVNIGLDSESKVFAEASRIFFNRWHFIENHLPPTGGIWSE